MPRVPWPLRNGRPCIEIVVISTKSGASVPRLLLADTGAGSRSSRFDLLLNEKDCVSLGANPLQQLVLAGAFAGQFPTFGIQVRIPALNFDQNLRVVGVPAPPAGFDGIACFPFLRRFTYGSFGNPDEFGLEL